MKKLIVLLAAIAILSSCAVNKTYIRDYNQQIQLVKRNFPEIYDLYRHGAIIIDSVYTYDDKNGINKVHINYHFRPYYR